jgi:hypothetical protein
MAANARPTLSEVRAFTGDYLIDAARHWSDSSQRWADAFDGLMRDVAGPAASHWSGEAAPVRAAEAAGYAVGEDFSLTTIESMTSESELAARETQMRNFGMTIRSDVLALTKADELVAGRIAKAANGLRSLTFDDDPNAHEPIQTVSFHGVPLPEKPPNPPAIPPSEGWSADPLMRAAQKIAYGHASDPDGGHMGDFPEMDQSGLARLIYEKMQRAISEPYGLVLGGTSTDGVPVIYDPKDNVLIIRDTRPQAPDGGTVFKPNDPSTIPKKFGSYVPAFTWQDLADGNTPAPSSGPPSSSGGGAPGGETTDITTSATPNERPLGMFPNWGTSISPADAAKTDGEIGNLGKIVLGQVPPQNPDNIA